MKKVMWIVFFSAIFVVISFSQIAGVPREDTLIVDITHGRATAPSNFNIFTTSWNIPSRGIHQVMLESLWIVDPTTGEVINALAAEGPIYNEDFTQMTVKLRKGCYWSDGVEITADDIVYGIETTMSNSGMSYNAQFVLYVDKVYKTDDYTVVFELKEPNARFHANFIDRWGAWRPFPKHIFEKVADPVSFDFNPPVSSGPYVLKDYDQAGYWVLWERRKDWNRTPTGILYGEPKPEYVLFYYYGEETNKIIAQANHNLDITELSFEGLRALMQKNPTSRGYYPYYPWIINHSDPVMTGFQYNNMKFPFNIKDVRWALTLAIDIVDYTSIAFDGTVAMGVLHVPPTPIYQKVYYEPMEEWLKNFTLDIEVNGEPFKPYDPSATLRAAQYARERGYKVPDDINELKEMFGPGWWKYAPDVAEQLLLRNGFKRDKNGKWLLPDGTPWKITIVTQANPVHPQHRNAFALAQQWRNFGIDVSVSPMENYNIPEGLGQFEVCSEWPATEPWGGHPDLYRVFNPWHSKYFKPVGEQAVNNPGAASRWTNPQMDKIIDEMEKLDWDDPRNIELGIEGLKILVEELPTVPTFSGPKVQAWDEYYWTNYPVAENSYTQPMISWPNLKYMLPFLEPTGRK